MPEGSAVSTSAFDLRLVIDSLPFPAWFTDAEAIVLGVNQPWVAFTGVTDDRALGDGWYASVVPEDRGEVRTQVLSALAAGSALDFLARLVRADGAPRWMRVFVMPIRDAGGEITSCLGTWYDVDDARRSAERLRIAAAANAALIESPGLEATFAALGELIVPALADWCSLHRAQDDGSLLIVATHHRDPARAAAAEAIRGTRFRVSAGSAHEAFRTGRPQVRAAGDIDEVANEMLRSGAPATLVAAVRAMGYRSGIAVPLRHREQVVGTLHAVRSEPESGVFDERDVPLFTEIAATAAAAIVQAATLDALVASYEREHRVATVLQEGALPKSLPEVAGIRFDGYYAPAQSEALIGGDWYDALCLPDGRVVISIGDVLGSGLDAAVTMSNLRHVIRGVAQVHPDPATLLHAADRTLYADRPDRIVTAFVGILTPATSTLTYASAGHPPPLLRGPDGEIVELRADALPLGLREGNGGATPTIRIAPGSLLLLYTDGLVESTRDVFEGERRVRAALADRAVREAVHPARALHDAVLFDGARDDVAILTVAFA